MLKTIRSAVIGTALVLSIAGCAATPPEVAGSTPSPSRASGFDKGVYTFELFKRPTRVNEGLMLQSERRTASRKASMSAGVVAKEHTSRMSGTGSCDGDQT